MLHFKQTNFYTAFTRNTTEINPVTSNNNSSSSSVEIAFLVQASVCVCANAALLVFLSTQRELRCKVANQFFANLLVVHVVLNVIGIIAKSRYHLRDEEIIINNGFLVEMFFSLIITTVDRFINIRYPFKYERITTRVVLLIITVSWTVSGLIVGLSVVLGTSQYRCTVILTSLLLTAFIILIFSNLSIFLIARRHVRIIRRNTVCLRTLRGTTTRYNDTVPKMTKSTYACFAIIMSFIVLWCPYLVHNILVLLRMYEPSSERVFTRCVVHFAWCSSLVDPALYICFNRSAKKELKKTFQVIHHLHRVYIMPPKKTTGLVVTTTSFAMTTAGVAIPMPHRNIPKPLASFSSIESTIVFMTHGFIGNDERF